MTTQQTEPCIAFVENGSVTIHWYPPDAHPACHKVQIKRLRHDEFTYGVQYAEYFEDFKPEDADTIHTHNLPDPQYTDNDVKIGCTYSYWVTFDNGASVGPASVKVRDPEVWWPYEKTHATMTGLVERHGGLVSMKQYGATVGGSPLEGIVAGNPEKLIAFVGLIHPGESGPELILPVVERLVASDPELLRRCGVAVLPAVNRDERERMVRGVPYYMRTNARGIDLNRNFDGAWEEISYAYGDDTSDPKSSTYRGAHPESEPETQAVVAFVKENAPKAIVSMHWLASVAGDRFLATKFAAGDTEYKAMCDPFGALYSKGFRGDDEPAPNGVEYIGSGGSIPSWAYQKLRIIGLDAEHFNDEPGQVCRFDHTHLAYLNEYRDRYYRAVKNVLEATAS